VAIPTSGARPGHGRWSAQEQGIRQGFPAVDGGKINRHATSSAASVGESTRGTYSPRDTRHQRRDQVVPRNGIDRASTDVTPGLCVRLREMVRRSMDLSTVRGALVVLWIGKCWRMAAPIHQEVRLASTYRVILCCGVRIVHLRRPGSQMRVVDRFKRRSTERWLTGGHHGEGVSPQPRR
jgi:hypothetical protein